MNSKIFFVLAFTVILSLVLPIGTAYSEELTDLQIELKFTNGDRASGFQKHFVVYQDHNPTPYLEKKFEGNPESVLLPQNHQYRVEVFANGLFSEVGYVKLADSPEKLEITLPLSGGLKFNVFFEDGETPIENAVIKIKNQYGEEQQVGNTNEDGDTLRFWIAPTIVEGDYYVADVYLGEYLATSVSNISVTKGIQQNQKIVVPIPEVVEDLITFELYNIDSQKLFKKDGYYSILLEDQRNEFSVESTMNSKGLIYFSNIPSALYSVTVLKDGQKDITWADTQVPITGNQNDFELIQNSDFEPIVVPFANSESSISGEAISVIIEEPQSNPLPEPIVYESTINEYTLSCNCVAFRMDDIQDYWISNSQIAIIEMFSKHDIPLSTGVIIDTFGEDSTIVDVVKNGINNGDLEIVNHFISEQPLTDFNAEQLDKMLKESTRQFKEKLSVTPTAFIPPQNIISKDTMPLLRVNGFTVISSMDQIDTPPYSLENESLYRFPQGATTGEYDESLGSFVGLPYKVTFANTLKSLEDYGFAVVTLHPQEFSILEDGVHYNEVDLDQLKELEKLIEKIKSENLKTVFMSEIEQNISKVLIVEEESDSIFPQVIPKWIKNNAGWWRDGQISDTTFVQGVQYLINKDVIQVTANIESSGNKEIPSWIKENAGLWAESKISDDDFIFGLTYLVNQEIVVIDI